jgi:hypothetical protein
MLRMLLATAAAFALAASQPAFACPDCKDCQHHKGTAEKTDKNAKAPSCDCAKECKCAELTAARTVRRRLPRRRKRKKT